MSKIFQQIFAGSLIFAFNSIYSMDDDQILRLCSSQQVIGLSNVQSYLEQQEDVDIYKHMFDFLTKEDSSIDNIAQYISKHNIDAISFIRNYKDKAYLTLDLGNNKEALKEMNNNITQMLIDFIESNAIDKAIFPILKKLNILETQNKSQLEQLSQDKLSPVKTTLVNHMDVLRRFNLVLRLIEDNKNWPAKRNILRVSMTYILAAVVVLKILADRALRIRDSKLATCITNFCPDQFWNLLRMARNQINYEEKTTINILNGNNNAEKYCNIVTDPVDYTSVKFIMVCLIVTPILYILWHQCKSLNQVSTKPMSLNEFSDYAYTYLNGYLRQINELEQASID